MTNIKSVYGCLFQNFTVTDDYRVYFDVIQKSELLALSAIRTRRFNYHIRSSGIS